MTKTKLIIIINNSLQVIDSLTMVSAKRIESFDFATMYTNLSLNVVFKNGYQEIIPLILVRGS